jgi:hypothetical protein
MIAKGRSVVLIPDKAVKIRKSSAKPFLATEKTS